MLVSSVRAALVVGVLACLGVLAAACSDSTGGNNDSPVTATPPPNSAPAVQASYDTSTAVTYDLCAAGAARPPLTCSMSFAALGDAITRGELKVDDTIKKPSMPTYTLVGALPEFQGRFGAGGLPASLTGVYSLNFGSGDVRTLTLPAIVLGVADKTLPLTTSTLVKIPSMPKEIFDAGGVFPFLFP
jgi:hypothetical protein